MKRLAPGLAVSTIATILAATAAVAEPSTISIDRKFQPDPLIVSGISGGQKSSGDCGNVAAKPNQVIRVKEALDLRFAVQSSGQPTLLVESVLPNGAKGRFCVPADNYSGGYIEIPGHWEAGIYSIYVGDRAQGQHPYTLSISQK